MNRYRIEVLIDGKVRAVAVVKHRSAIDALTHFDMAAVIDVRLIPLVNGVRVTKLEEGVERC